MKWLPTGCGLLTALAAAGALVWWLGQPAAPSELRVPGMDGAPEASASIDPDDPMGARVDLRGKREVLREGPVAPWPGSWSRFRGDTFDNISSGTPVPVDTWSAQGLPREVWSVSLGEGYAAPAVRNGRVYVLDYDESLAADMLRCFELSSGEELWRRWYDVELKRNHGFSRTVPAVNDDVVVTIGPRCHVLCADARTGEFKWGVDLESEYGTRVPLWYTGQCPLLDGKHVILAPGGDALMVALDLETGEEVWRTENPEGMQMSHASILPTLWEGRRVFTYPALGGLVGVEADGNEAGKLAWRTPAWNAQVIAPSAVHLGDGRFFVTAGYGAGGMLLRVPASGEAEVLYKHRPREGLASEQQTALWYKGHLFAIMPKDGGGLKNQLVCWDPAGRVVWSSGREKRFGLGPYALIDGKLFILDDDGVLTVAEASLTGYRELASSRVLEGPDAWGPMAFVPGRLLVRDVHRMVCLDVGGR